MQPATFFDRFIIHYVLLYDKQQLKKIPKFFSNYNLKTIKWFKDRLCCGEKHDFK